MEKLPVEVVNLIYEYDGTKFEKQSKVVTELQCLLRVSDLFFRCSFYGDHEPSLYRYLKRITRLTKKGELKQFFYFLANVSLALRKGSTFALNKPRLPKRFTKFKLVQYIFFHLYPTCPVRFKFHEVYLWYEYEFIIPY